MRNNTPPRILDFDDDDELVEEVDLGGDMPPQNDDDNDNDDDDELEMEEVTLAELEQRLGMVIGEEDNDAANDYAAGDAARIAAICDNAQLTMSKHTGPIFACSLHSQQPWAVTGGEDDRAIVWNINNGEILYEYTKHKDTVTETHFSHDGRYLVTGDLSGDLFVHKLAENHNERPLFNVVWEYSIGDMSWLRWHRNANVLLAGCDTGEIYIWRIPSGACKILPGQAVRTETAELTYDGKKLLVGYNNGTIKLWNLQTCSTIVELNNEEQPMALTGSALAVTCHFEAPIYACGDSEGNIVCLSNNGAVGTLQTKGSVECLGFAPSAERHVLASGTLDGQIAIWDYSKYTLRVLCENPNPEDGILRLKWLSEHTLLVCTQQGNVHAFDARSGLKKYTLTGHHYDIYEFAYNAIENSLLTVSEDGTAKIFKLPELCD